MVKLSWLSKIKKKIKKKENLKVQSFKSEKSLSWEYCINGVLWVWKSAVINLHGEFYLIIVTCNAILNPLLFSYRIFSHSCAIGRLFSSDPRSDIPLLSPVLVLADICWWTVGVPLFHPFGYQLHRNRAGISVSSCALQRNIHSDVDNVKFENTQKTNKKQSINTNNGSMELEALLTTAVRATTASIQQMYHHMNFRTAPNYIEES